MKAIVSSTYDDKYFFFLPIINWCWNKLEVDVICFMPEQASRYDYSIYQKWLTRSTLIHETAKSCQFQYFKCPDHKQATYAQCSRLYAGSLDLPEDEILITSDVDMAVFRLHVMKNAFSMKPDFPFAEVIGHDLVPANQFPMCYISAPVREWRLFMGIGKRSYQMCLDELLGNIECESFRGNYWGKDQETVYDKITTSGRYFSKTERARPGTQFADNRLDRDDAFLLDRLSPDIIDYHMPRPGYEDKSFEQILTILKYFYPQDDFAWLINYRNEYIKLL